MESYGFGGKTFRFEADATGKAVVHRMAGQFTADYYEEGTFGKVTGEIHEQFDTYNNIYLVVVDSGYLIDGAPGVATVGSGHDSGIAAITGDLSFLVAAHELGHTFGLYHDFRNDNYIMSYGFKFRPTLSKCTAELLVVHPYFNPVSQGQRSRNTSVKMLSLPSLVSSPNVIRLRFKVTDPDGLHQARLLTPDVIVAGEITGGFLACKRLNGVSSSVEFVTAALTPQNKSVSLRIIDVHGNISESQSYPIDVTSLLSPPEVVSIPDANLAAVVRETLGLSPGVPLTSHAMLGLQGLGAGSHQITNLTGLEHAHSLTWLNLTDNSLSDISALSGLTQLTTLYLSGTSLSDISALSGLTQLTELYLRNNTLSDISALSGLTKLTELNLGHNSLSDISALSGLTQLTWLFHGNTSLSDISALSGLTQLTELNLDNNALSDISALSGLTQLRTLYLSGNSLSDISALSGLTQLKDLRLHNTSLSDISALSGLTKLTWLFLGSNSLSDISALSGLTQLTGLDLGNNSISDVSPLLGLDLTGFPWTSTGLYLSGNPLSYASINTHLPAMQAKGIEIAFNPRTPTTLVKISGDGQQAAVNTSLPHPFVVEVRDQYNRAFSGVPVTFTVTAGGGTLSVTSTTTDANGRAQAHLTLGPSCGYGYHLCRCRSDFATCVFYCDSDPAE